MQYNSDFYTQGLSAPAKQQHQHAVEIMRNYATGAVTTSTTFPSSISLPAAVRRLDSDGTGGGEEAVSCRRVFILRYFGETPSYIRCGSCDTCHAHSSFADDQRRDFSLEAGALLAALQFPASRDFTATNLLAKVLGKGSSVGASVSAGGVGGLRRLGHSDSIRQQLLSKYTRLEDVKTVRVLTLHNTI